MLVVKTIIHHIVTCHPYFFLWSSSINSLTIILSLPTQHPRFYFHQIKSQERSKLHQSCQPGIPRTATTPRLPGPQACRRHMQAASFSPHDLSKTSRKQQGFSTFFAGSGPQEAAFPGLCPSSNHRTSHWEGAVVGWFGRCQFLRCGSRCVLCISRSSGNETSVPLLC